MTREKAIAEAESIAASTLIEGIILSPEFIEELADIIQAGSNDTRQNQ